MKVIGITGGVGAGKSTVLSYILKVANAKVIFSDDLAKSLEKRGEVCFTPLVDLLGEDILGEDGEIVPGGMAAKIYEDKSLLKKVNDIVHPAVKTRILEIIDRERKEEKTDYLFIEAALLIECGYKAIVDEMWYVSARPEVRRERLKESRGYSDEKIEGIFKSQLPDETFRKESDVVIDNSDDFEATKKQIEQLLVR